MNAHSCLCRLRRCLILRCAALAIVALTASSLGLCGEIHDAATKGDLEKVKALLKDNPKLVSSRDATGETPLILAAYYGHKDVVDFLLANKADVDTRDNKGVTALHSAAVNGFQDVAEALLAHSADINARDNHGMTPLHYAAFFGRKNVAELLLASKADINAKDDKGATPLHWAAFQGHKEVAELLLARGAEANVKDNDGMTALLRAVVKGDNGIAGLLIAYKVNVNAADKEGNTPLHVAAGEGHRDIVELLLAHGADVNAKNGLGQAPLDVAKIGKHEDIVELLLAHGAKAGTAETTAKAPKASGDQDLLRQLTGVSAKAPATREVDRYDHNQSTEPVPAGAKATVYFFREHGILGFGLKPPIYCDNVELAHLQNGRYFRVQLEPGRHFFRSKPGAPGTTLDAEAGGVYYIRAVMVQGGSLLLAPLRSEESPPLDKVKALDANQVIDHTRVAAQGEIPDNPTVEQ
jgi:ankyrin repeat protein